MPSGFTWLWRVSCVCIVPSFLSALNLKYLTCNLIMSCMYAGVDTVPCTLTFGCPGNPFYRFLIWSQEGWVLFKILQHLMANTSRIQVHWVLSDVTTTLTRLCHLLPVSPEIFMRIMWTPNWLKLIRCTLAYSW